MSTIFDILIEKLQKLFKSMIAFFKIATSEIVHLRCKSLKFFKIFFVFDFFFSQICLNSLEKFSMFRKKMFLTFLRLPQFPSQHFKQFRMFLRTSKIQRAGKHQI